MAMLFSSSSILFLNLKKSIIYLYRTDLFNSLCSIRQLRIFIPTNFENIVIMLFGLQPCKLACDVAIFQQTSTVNISLRIWFSNFLQKKLLFLFAEQNTWFRYFISYPDQPLYVDYVRNVYSFYKYTYNWLIKKLIY